MPVQLERHEAVALIRLDRPDVLNALSAQMLDDIEAALGEIEADTALRAVVITGAGEKAFSAGADISAMREASALEARAYASRGHAVTARIEAFPLPVIAAVNGYALGGGCELALACDVRLAGERARFGLPEINLGILPGWGGTQRLARLTNPAFAKEAIFTGRMIDAAEAQARGLANDVHGQDLLLDEALALAATMASKPAWALAQAKAMVNLALGGDQAGGLARELDAFALAFTTGDQREGMAAFLDKRPANFAER